ncbi:Surfactin synthase thioesterase subunit [Chitinophaga eiseniae]|uniref:Surfactin synthase thioesterase subunit n=1 Tax=Chitinophaga eiseniae TaxID=634771 RepID=A0A1T4U712_9BACT|nr:alpha/beta fold hydrolase [Chitinophaga eiseniae]SKA48308.1 Surfactin synthase thioesterase subunit [Chitinophaga eiseniae]
MKKPQLFLLHFAGGNYFSYQSMIPYLHGFEVISPELPGRGKRIMEPLVTTFEEAAADIFRQITARLSGRFFIYGHSMGAYLALQVAHMLEHISQAPEAVWVSGTAGPDYLEHTGRHLLSGEGLTEELKKLGGIPDEFWEDDDLFSFFEPVIRADFEIVDTCYIPDGTCISAPLYAMMGEEEENAQHIGCWEKFTRAAFKSQLFPGKHFFIHDHPAAIASAIHSVGYPAAGNNKIPEKSHL